MITRICVAAALSFLAMGSAGAADWPEGGKAVYSNLCTKAQSGDYAGYRMTVTRSGGKMSVQLEWGEGARMVGQADRMALESSRLAITLPEDHGRPAIAVSATVSATMVMLDRWDWGDGQGPQRVNLPLPRVPFDMPVGACATAP